MNQVIQNLKKKKEIYKYKQKNELENANECSLSA